MQLVLHIRRGLPRSEELNLDRAFNLPSVKIVELAGRFFVRWGIVGIWVEQIVSHRLDVGMVLGI